MINCVKRLNKLFRGSDKQCWRWERKWKRKYCKWPKVNFRTIHSYSIYNWKKSPWSSLLTAYHFDPFHKVQSSITFPLMSFVSSNLDSFITCWGDVSKKISTNQIGNWDVDASKLLIERNSFVFLLKLMLANDLYEFACDMWW